jgi:hypothetical protein
MCKMAVPIQNSFAFSSKDFKKIERVGEKFV